MGVAELLGACAAVFTIVAGNYQFVRWLRRSDPSQAARPLGVGLAAPPAVPTEQEILGWRKQAWHMAQNGRPDEAIALFSKCLYHKPKSADSHHGRGVAYMNKDRVQHRNEAIADLRSAVRLNRQSRARWTLNSLLNGGATGGGVPMASFASAQPEQENYSET
jgi:tetratricopeptide (TPR) repeat protein